MTTFEMTDIGPPLQPGDVETVEQRLGCSLPLSYVRFLQAHNGGTPEPDAFRGRRPGDAALVHFFFGVNGEEPINLVENATFFREYHDVPATLLPIARTTSGDLVCIGIVPGNHGEVWFWSHDHPVREEATWKLADDLDAFLATFHAVVLEQ